MDIFADILKVCLTSVVSIIILFFFCRLGGQKQISQMSMFDYINSITIGSIAAEFATNLEQWWRPFSATVIYGVAALIISILSCKSLKLRHMFAGQPLILYQDGKIFRANLLRARLNLNEFLAQCRIAGYFDLNDLEAAVLETSGQISFLPRSDHRPATPRDLDLVPPQESLAVNLILDGKVLDGNLHHFGKDRKWLDTQLRKHGIHKIEHVFLASCDRENNFTVFRLEEKPTSWDIFE